MMKKFYSINKKSTQKTSRWIVFLVIVLILTTSGMTAWIVQADPGTGENLTGSSSLNDQINSLVGQFEDQDYLRVIVQLKIPDLIINSKNHLSEIQKAQRDLINGLNLRSTKLVHEYKFIPFVAMEVDQAGFEALRNSPMVVGIEEDILMVPSLDLSIPRINADDVWNAGYTGAGQVVAVLDTGVDKNHPDLAGKVVSEACYSSTTSTTISMCPGGVGESIEPNSALPYVNNCPIGECDHGTHVAGIVAANGTSVKGVAKDAELIAIQVFSLIPSNSIGSWSSDQIKGLERVYALKDSYNISSVNLSLGSQYPYLYTDVCDGVNQAYLMIVNTLKSVGIATIAASGNEFYTNAISSPACISTVISVGATTDADSVASYSNSAFFLDLLAPGSNINSTIPGDYANYSGTSMAAPHVAGAWALMRSYQSDVTNDVLLNIFKDTGIPILDTRNSITKPRIDLLAAAQELTRINYLPPENITASDGTDLDVVIVSWDAKVDADYYQIYRNTNDSKVNATLLPNNPVSNSYNDTSAIAGTLYYYWSKACQELGCSDFSISDSGWRDTGSLIPTIPTGVFASDGTYSDKIQVSWYGVGGATKYKLFRNTSNSLVNAELLAEPTTLLYNDITVLNNLNYYYWLQACNIDVCSDYSISDIGTINNIQNIFLPLITK